MVDVILKLDILWALHFGVVSVLKAKPEPFISDFDKNDTKYQYNLYPEKEKEKKRRSLNK